MEQQLEKNGGNGSRSIPKGLTKSRLEKCHPSLYACNVLNAAERVRKINCLVVCSTDQSDKVVRMLAKDFPEVMFFVECRGDFPAAQTYNIRYRQDRKHAPLNWAKFDCMLLERAGIEDYQDILPPLLSGVSVYSSSEEMIKELTELIQGGTDMCRTKRRAENYEKGVKLYTKLEQILKNA